MRFLLRRRESPVIAPVDSNRYISVNKLTNSIEKANKTLAHCRRIGNPEAIATWERICAALQLRWTEAMIEVSTGGRYNYE